MDNPVTPYDLPYTTASLNITHLKKNENWLYSHHHQFHLQPLITPGQFQYYFDLWKSICTYQQKLKINFANIKIQTNGTMAA